MTMARAPVFLAPDAAIGVTAVRRVEDKQLVGFFMGLDEDGLWRWIDTVCDPLECEYAVLDRLILTWPGKTPPLPLPDDFFNHDAEDEDAGFHNMVTGEPTDDDLAEAEWIPFARGNIYFAKAGTRLKIGFAKNVDTRIKALQTGCPDRIEVLGTMPGDRREEQAYHRQFAHLREVGEWFRLEGDLIDFVTEVLSCPQ